MKVRYKKRNIFAPFMIILSVLMSALCFMSYNSGSSSILAKGLGLVITPFQSAASSVNAFFCGIANDIGSFRTLSDENKALKAENERLQKENNHAQIILKQNNDLYEYLDLKREHTDLKFVNAKIIARTSSNYTSTFTIDKGSFHGVTENMPIITSDDSVIGVVFSVDMMSAKCLAITSYDFSVGVYDERTGNTGLLSGDFDLFNKNKCLIKGLLAQTDVKKGDRILTSGLGDVYPSGLIIGTVEEIIPDENSYTVGAVVNPGKALLDADNVMVITSFDKSYE